MDRMAEAYTKQVIDLHDLQSKFPNSVEIPLAGFVTYDNVEIGEIVYKKFADGQDRTWQFWQVVSKEHDKLVILDQWDTLCYVTDYEARLAGIYKIENLKTILEFNELENAEGGQI